MTGTLQRLIALILLFCPTALLALGLGDIRLNSALNEPLDAEIELVGAAPDELSSLRASLASPETFTRYGLEHSPFLSKIEFKVGQGRDGRPALLVRSRESVPDAFLTLLVDVNWSRGRLLREYTMLLDPPIYTPGAEQAASAPVSAPQAGDTESARSGAVERAPQTRPESAAPSGVSRAPEAPSSGAMAGSSYTVRNNDTLWRIASGLKPGATSDVNRMMLAIYRANPQAFSGNINDMRAGAILRVPAEAEFDSVGTSEASAEVRRQYAEWRTNRGVASSGAPAGERLRLVTPKEGGEGTGTQAAAGAQSQELRDKVTQLENQLAESRRMLEVKDSELAKLQQQLGKPAQPTPAPTPAPAPAPTAETPPAETPPAEAPTETPTEATTAPPAVEPQPTPAEQPKPTPAPTAPVAEEKPSILDWVIEHWYYAAAALLILVLLWLAARRRRQEPDFSNLGSLADAARGGGAGLAREPRMDREPVTTPVRANRAAEDTFLVEESGERQQPRMAKAAEPAGPERARAEPGRRAKSADDTLSSETAINLDQGDPLAEADFHMAYGLYDQAADLVRIAIEREPKRRDLKLKLLEIFFVWGNKDAFLQAARELAQTRQDAGPGEWEKIAIMGRQISPEDPMFAQAPGAAGAAAADVDLNLEGGENRVDLDLLGPSEGEAGGGIDLDLGTAGDDTTAETGESLALKDQSLDFPLEDQTTRSDGSATTREMAARTMETPTIETETYRGHDVPTVESPALRGRDSPTIKEKIDSAIFRKDETLSDQTAELALDDLGLELSELAAAQSDPLEQTDHPANAPTMLAGLDEKSRRLLAEAEARRGRLGDDEDTKISPTGTWVLEDKTMAATLALPGAPDRDTSATTARNRALSGDGTGDTARRRRLDTDSTAQMPRGGGEEMDLDLDRLEAALTSDTVKQPRKSAADEDRFASDVFGAKDLAATDLDLDVGEVNRERDREPTGTARIPADEMGLPELEPVTMSEVGTKLDLARAYMDMGDPEGARSILEEVLQEGSATQKQEAQRLIESLPG